VVSCLSGLEIVVSHEDLSRLPDKIIKIQLVETGLEINPKKRLYIIGEPYTLFFGVSIEVYPHKEMIKIKNKKIRIDGVTHISCNNDIHWEMYSNIRTLAKKLGFY